MPILTRAIICTVDSFIYEIDAILQYSIIQHEWLMPRPFLEQWKKRTNLNMVHSRILKSHRLAHCGYFASDTRTCCRGCIICRIRQPSHHVIVRNCCRINDFVAICTVVLIAYIRLARDVISISKLNLEGLRSLLRIRLSQAGASFGAIRGDAHFVCGTPEWHQSTKIKSITKLFCVSYIAILFRIHYVHNCTVPASIRQ